MSTVRIAGSPFLYPVPLFSPIYMYTYIPHSFFSFLLCIKTHRYIHYITAKISTSQSQMSPPKQSFTNDDDQRQNPRRLTINARPSPLKIGKESQTIEKQRRQPVIIYTHSPKIIHTQARDFMALVQRLTGLSGGPRVAIKEPGSADCDESNHRNGGLDRMLSPANSCLADIPLFTPSGADLNIFCSPRRAYRFDDAAANVGRSSLSPSVLEFMKGGLPEY